MDSFVFRLRPETSTDEVVSLLNETFPTCCSVKAVKLDTRFNSYSSFQVEIYVKRSEFDIMLSSVYMEDNWPYGVLVRRFFRNNKNGVKKAVLLSVVYGLCHLIVGLSKRRLLQSKNCVIKMT